MSLHATLPSCFLTDQGFGTNDFLAYATRALRETSGSSLIFQTEVQEFWDVPMMDFYSCACSSQFFHFCSLRFAFFPNSTKAQHKCAARA